jgi:heavy metal translocating P-type ATPase
MQVVHEVRGRIRFRTATASDPRLYPDFVETLPQRVKGVRSARANPVARSLVVDHDGSTHTRSALLGLMPEIMRSTSPGRQVLRKPDGGLRRTLVAGTVFLTGLLIPTRIRAVLTWAIAVPTILEGVGSLLTRGLTIEVLDAAAIAIAMGRRDFSTAGATLTLIHLGNYLETTTSQSSTDLLRRLLAKPPSRAWIEAADGSLTEISADEVREGDIVRVGPGDMIPVDGQVVAGAATVNQSSITGESIPVDREAGARVLSGGVVEAGRLRIRAVRVGSATTTARIAAFIESALDRKPAIQSNAERLARHRILFTLGLGLVTFFLTRDLRRLASIFLVDYSCALKLGVPVAMKSALYHGAKAGILIKGGEGIEALADVDTVVFDKTGTLTFGSLTVTDIVPVDANCSEEQLLSLLASLEEHATHPVADAIVVEARRRALGHIHHDEVDFIVAHGLVSEAEGRRVVVGSRHFLEEHEKTEFAAFETLSERLEDEGKIVLYAAFDGRPAGVVGLRDRPRPEAAGSLAQLRRLGVESLVLLTGDREPKARALAADLGLDAVFAEQRPEEKAIVVRDLQAAGRRVAFVGDGVNDAPALIAADVGIAMPRGADLARATADVVLLRDEIAGVVESRALAGDTIRLIRSNFNWAVTLNTLLFLAATTGRASPVFSAIAHNSVTIGTLVRALIGPRFSSSRGRR